MLVLVGQGVLDSLVGVGRRGMGNSRGSVGGVVVQVGIHLGPLVTHLEGHVLKSSLEVSMQVLSHESGMVGEERHGEVSDVSLEMDSSIEEVETAQQPNLAQVLSHPGIDIGYVLQRDMPDRGQLFSSVAGSQVEFCPYISDLVAGRRGASIPAVPAERA